jgi:ceramide synthetase
MKGRIESIIHSKYEGEERAHKTTFVLKLSFDTIFYTSVTVFAYLLFRQEYWFPSMAGGCGSCSQIYK